MQVACQIDMTIRVMQHQRYDSEKRDRCSALSRKNLEYSFTSPHSYAECVARLRQLSEHAFNTALPLR